MNYEKNIILEIELKVHCEYDENGRPEISRNALMEDGRVFVINDKEEAIAVKQIQEQDELKEQNNHE